jgi:adenylate cyclase
MSATLVPRGAVSARSHRDLRLASGLVLFTYVTLHLVCHAFGLISIDAAEAALRLAVSFWHSGVGTVLLYGAASIHVGLALLAVYDRRTLRMAPVQALRIVLGLTMPVVLIGHFVGTRYAFEHFGLPADYHRVVANLWATKGQGRQLALLAPGWLHGCLGLNFAFGSRPFWRRLRFVLFGAALLLPVLAGLGFLMMGRELAERPVAIDVGRAPAASTPVEGAALIDMREDALAVYLGLIGLMIAARAVRSINERRNNSVIRISYPGRSVSVPPGWTVLEASRAFGIPHQSTCGGRARCTTCRVRVTAGQARCPTPAIDERRALDRIDAEADVRLACQLRPTGDISVQPLVAVEQDWWRAAPPERTTTERDVAILLFEVRFGTADGASVASAHDTLYALDHFHAIATAAIESAGGVQCRHSGDSWTAVFGLDTGGIRPSFRQALIAAQYVEERSAALTSRLARELGFDSSFSIVVHIGPVVAGMIGEGEARRLSAVGDAIRVAERLCASARRNGERFAISQAAANAAGIADPTFTWYTADDGEPPILTGPSARVLALAPRDSG